MESTAKFLRMMNATNDSIVSREAEELAQQAQKHVGMDPVRVQRDAKRRERLGTLRAVPSSLFRHTNLS